MKVVNKAAASTANCLRSYLQSTRDNLEFPSPWNGDRRKKLSHVKNERTKRTMMRLVSVKLIKAMRFADIISGHSSNSGRELLRFNSFDVSLIDDITLFALHQDIKTSRHQENLPVAIPFLRLFFDSPYSQGQGTKANSEEGTAKQAGWLSERSRHC